MFDSEQDNVEQKQTEQQQQKVLEEALQDTMLNIEEPPKPLSSRQGGLRMSEYGECQCRQLVGIFFNSIC